MKKYWMIPALMVLVISCAKHEKRETKYENGQLQEKFFVKQTKDGSYIKDGDYKSWYENGQNEDVGKYFNNVKVGNWKSWYENGQLKLDVNYVNDTLSGDYKEWYENGQKRSQKTLKMGKSVGDFFSWHENGKIFSERKYTDEGVIDGLQTQWYEDGTKWQEETYISGKKEGLSLMWNSKGKLIAKREFKNGEDINLPATYRDWTGGELTLNVDETYKLRYIKRSGFRSDWAIATGEFFLYNNHLILKDHNMLSIQKFNADTIQLAGAPLYVRVK